MTNSDNNNDDKKPKGDKGGNQPPKPPWWSRDKLVGLDTKQLEQLSLNAEKKGEDELVLLCIEILDERKPKKSASPRSGGVRRNIKETDPRHLANEKEAIGKLTALGEELLRKFDFSKETAKRLSEGTKRFIPHSFLGKDGSPKTGGGRQSGFLYEDRYISYRLGDQAISFSVIRFPDSESLVFEVRGPENLISKPVKIWEARPYLEIGATDGNYEAAQQFGSFEEAETAFSGLVEKFVPKRDS